MGSKDGNLLIACDDNYRGSEQRRCATVFVYERLVYIQDRNGNYMVAGINGPGNSINFRLIESGPNMGDLLTSAGRLPIELRPEIGGITGEYEPNNFVFYSYSIHNTECVLSLIVSVISKLIVN
ncbi:uncharacterized protein LOC142354577 [Convolutriloba macropyga]|uniref:uncharacterized protein LOC142354577 n=1 Tax=Convolutriloba macropyga TaxID=536237 RepID=UPI003F528C80